MSVHPEIFISSASRDLKSCRHLVRDALLTMGCVPVVQDNFPPGAGEVRAMLRARIQECHSVIHLAGECYGFEPRERIEGEPRRSYTQMEYDIARELGKPLYTFICEPGFPYDAHEPEAPELRALQDAHRAAVAAGDAIFVPIKNAGELNLRVRELQTRVETLSRDLEKTRGWLGRGLAAALAALVLLAGGIYAVKRRGDDGQTQAEARAARAEAQIAALQGQLERQTKLIDLVSQKLEGNAFPADGPAKGNPAAVAREETARQLGISVEKLEKGLEGEGADVRALLGRIEQGGVAGAGKGAGWRKLKFEALTKLGDSEKAAGHYAAEIEPYRQALALVDKEREPSFWCDAAYDLEVALWQMGRYAEAEPLGRELVVRRTALQGKEGPETLRSVNTLALLLYTKGDYQESERLYRFCLEARERTLGAEHPDTLKSIGNLALLLEAKGNLPEVEALYRRNLEAQERTLGREHPDTLRSLHSLAHLLYAKGEYAEAEGLVRRCLEAQERTLGAEHPDTLRSVNTLALVLYARGSLAEAELLYRRNLEAQERTLGREHPDTLRSVDNLALLLYAKGNTTETESLYRRCLEARERTLGAEHPDTLASVNNLANLLYAKGNLAGAEPLYRRCLEAQERTLGKEHPSTLTSVNNLALLLAVKGDLAGAEGLYRRCLEAQERTLGREHRSTLLTLCSLAQVVDFEGNYAAAEPLYVRAKAGLEHIFPPGHRSRLDLDYHFSLLRQKQGRLAEALSLAEEVAANAGKTLPANSKMRLAYEKNTADVRARIAGVSPAPAAERVVRP